MYTRCPGCHTVHPVNAPLLARQRGKYRCGKCRQINDALEHLFDEWPDPATTPPVAGNLPELGLKLDLHAAKHARPGPGEPSFLAAEESEEDQGQMRGSICPEMDGGRAMQEQLSRTLRPVWITAAIALLVLVTVGLAEFLQQPLPGFSAIKDRLSGAKTEEPSHAAPFRDLDQLQLLSRDMRSHPTRPDTLSLSLTIVNRAPRPQAFPELEVILLDTSGQALVSRLFKTDEYLAEDTDITAGMTPQAYLHIRLNIDDPGHQAVGFELHFR